MEALRRKIIDNQTFIFDPIRKKWLVQTPEEEVRVWFLSILINKFNYSRGQIAVERGIELSNGKNFRVDILVSSKEGNPLILVECKAPSIKIDGETFRQSSKYNSHLKARYIVLTNGHKNYFYETFDFINYSQIASIPLNY